MKTVKKYFFIIGMSLLFAACIALLLRYTPEQLHDRIESATYDWRYRLKYQDVAEDGFPDYAIHIVDIDERSMEKMGSYWGWDRGYQAKMIDSLSSHFPAMVAFDVLFYDLEDEIRYGRLASTLGEAIGGDSILKKYSAALNAKLAASVNYDVRFKDAIARCGRVTLGLSLAEESNYRDFTSQVSHRMDMKWHNSLNPASALILPDSLLARIKHKKTIIDGIYPENASAAAYVGHVNVVDASSVVRTMPLLYRFGNFPPTYLPMSIRVAASLFGTPNDEIVFKPGKYIDIGKPFKIFKGADGRSHFSYPDFTEAQFRIITGDRGEISKLEDGRKRNVSAYTALYRDDGGNVCIELRSGRLPYQLTDILVGRRLSEMEIGGETDIGYGFTVRRDSDIEWEIFSDGASFWLGALDVKTLSSLTLDDIKLERGKDRMLITFDFWVKKEKGELVSSLPILRAAALDELLSFGMEGLESMPGGGRLDLGKRAKIPLDDRNRHIVTYFGPKSYPFPYFSFYDIMENNVNYPMEGNIFIVGSTSPAMFDIKSAPHERVFPAVEIHASVMNSIFTDTYVRRLARWQDFLLLILVGFVAALTAFLTKPSFGWLIIGGLLVVYTFISFHIFDTSLIWVEMVRPMVTIVLAFTAIMVYRYITEEKNRKFLQSTFKQYLSPELIDMMYTQKQKPQLGGQECVCTAFFTDIAGFSTFSEKLGSPTRLVELLNEYLSAMTDILLSRYGTLDKYVGDAIIAFFGAPVHTPDHAVKACYAALDMQDKLSELRKKWRGEGDKWPQIVHEMRMRIGVNTGLITTGNMGSAIRMNYTMMGDPVNLAARLESAAKYYGVHTMISGFTYNMIHDHFETRKLDIITVVGKTEPVTVYELLCRKGELTEEAQALLKHYNQGVNRYYGREWDKARECFIKSDELEPNKKISTKTPSSRFKEMCEKYKDNPPPEDWDGVNTLTSK